MNLSQKLGSFKLLPLLSVLLMRCWIMWCAYTLLFLFVYWILGGLSAFTLIFFVVAGGFYFFQDRLLYHPEDNSQSRVYVQVPAAVDLPFEEIFIRSIDGVLIHMYFIPQADVSSAPTIVFFHGNAGNMGHRLQNAAGLYLKLSCNILMVEYRGYGLSKGYPSEKGICMDGRAAIDYLCGREIIDHTKIIVFGRSLGGAVAIDVVSRPEYASKVWCLILENTFTSIPDMAKALFKWKWLDYVPMFFYKNQLLSAVKIGSVRVPTLFISGLGDTLVPPSMMMELHSKCGSPQKHLVQLSAGGHNDTWTLPGYYSHIASFLTSSLPYRPSPPQPSPSISYV